MDYGKINLRCMHIFCTEPLMYLKKPLSGAQIIGRYLKFLAFKQKCDLCALKVALLSFFSG